MKDTKVILTYTEDYNPHRDEPLVGSVQESIIYSNLIDAPEIYVKI